MKLSDLIDDQWIVASPAFERLDEAVLRVLERVAEAGRLETTGLAQLAEGLASGGIGEMGRVNDDVIVVVAAPEEWSGGVRIGAGFSDAPVPVPSDRDEASRARAVLVVLTGGRPEGARRQLTPALARALKGPDETGALLAAGALADAARVKELLAVEYRPRLLVEDAVVPVQFRVYPETPLAEVIDLMVRRGVHAVPVVGEQFEVLGILTSGDALEYLLRRGRPGQGEQGGRPETDPQKARDLMRRSVLCVSEDQELVEAAIMMVNRDVEQLPVVREGELAGFITRKSILGALHRSLSDPLEDNEESEPSP